MGKRSETTDGRYIQVGKGEWWDTTGTEIVPEAAVDQYIRLNPNVGIVENDPRRES
jgi:hypothetical protein